jgi:hypothetical protein
MNTTDNKHNLVCLPAPDKSVRGHSTSQVAIVKMSTPEDHLSVHAKFGTSHSLPLRTNHFGQVPPRLVNVFSSYSEIVILDQIMEL